MVEKSPQLHQCFSCLRTGKRIPKEVVELKLQVNALQRAKEVPTGRLVSTVTSLEVEALGAMTSIFGKSEKIGVWL